MIHPLVRGVLEEKGAGIRAGAAADAAAPNVSCSDAVVRRSSGKAYTTVPALVARGSPSNSSTHGSSSCWALSGSRPLMAITSSSVITPLCARRYDSA